MLPSPYFNPILFYVKNKAQIEGWRLFCERNFGTNGLGNLNWGWETELELIA